LLGRYTVQLVAENGQILASRQFPVAVDEPTLRPYHITRDEFSSYSRTPTLLVARGTAPEGYRSLPFLRPAEDVDIEVDRRSDPEIVRVAFSIADPRFSDGEVVLEDADGVDIATTNYVIGDRVRAISRNPGDTVDVVAEDGYARVVLHVPHEQWVISEGRSLEEVVTGYVELSNRDVHLSFRDDVEVDMWSYSNSATITVKDE
jgi:hypothetical protein